MRSLGAIVSGIANPKTNKATPAMAAKVKKAALYPAAWTMNPAAKLLKDAPIPVAGRDRALQEVESPSSSR